MPFPIEYARSTEEFYKFMNEVKYEADFHSFHVTYTMVQSVFQVFRRRVEIQEALNFANCLPVGLRALFVKDWDTSETIKPFENLDIMNDEVKELRNQHNFAREDSIQIVARVLPNHVEKIYYTKMMESMSKDVQTFWQYK
jgi:uncharacterized protein (DUF2267 family)